MSGTQRKGEEAVEAVWQWQWRLHRWRWWWQVDPFSAVKDVGELRLTPWVQRSMHSQGDRREQVVGAREGSRGPTAWFFLILVARLA